MAEKWDGPTVWAVSDNHHPGYAVLHIILGAPVPVTEQPTEMVRF